MSTTNRYLTPNPLRLDNRSIIQKPLSRRGAGPGLLILTPESYISLPDRKTLDPEPCQKWAEEGFVVVNITVPNHQLGSGQSEFGACLDAGVQALRSSSECTGSDRLGLICMLCLSIDVISLLLIYV